ncbi:abortive infection system antitoxin AbiGi family protein [Myroides phaeus]|uniref:abortive infection system antitoxin AbiGi family protein n=1 Tax=Myroides phaeus TaxID=702745 RepID=UPI001303326E|nr:abortive infection system antitoxin AbiGi family protein [Myroides phaeus]
MNEYFNQNPDNILIHFTSKIEYLVSIIEESQFRLKYCKEEFCITNETIVSKNVHPMVCFSEQNLKEIQNKEITYGKFGISLSTDWIIKNNIQPVMYIEKNSPVANSLAILLEHRRSLPEGHKLRLPIMTIRGFVKNTVGYNSYFDQKDFVFKTENEWRFLPSKKQIGNGYISENRTTFLSNEDKYNSKLIKYPLRFTHQEITKIFYDDEQSYNLLKQKFPDLVSKMEKYSWK